MTIPLDEIDKFLDNLARKLESNHIGSPFYLFDSKINSVAEFITGINEKMQKDMPGNYILKIHEEDGGKFKITQEFFTEQDEIMFILKYS
jgi:hypothetical protein